MEPVREENDGTGALHLVVVELAEVFHIHLALARVGHRHQVAQGHRVGDNLFHGGFYITELADTGGLDEDAVRGIVPDHLLQGLAEVAHQAAADAAGIHLGDFNPGFLQKAAVDADFAELISISTTF